MDIHQSLQHILNSKDVFGHAFYDVFFSRYPEALEYFGDVDMKRQALVLTMALTVIQQYYSNNYSTVEQYLQVLGSQHHRRQIPPDLYPKWRDAMLEALESFHGKDWDPTLAREWRDAIEVGIEPMLRGYEERTGV